MINLISMNQIKNINLVNNWFPGISKSLVLSSERFSSLSTVYTKQEQTDDVSVGFTSLFSFSFNLILMSIHYLLLSLRTHSFLLQWLWRTTWWELIRCTLGPIWISSDIAHQLIDIQTQDLQQYKEPWPNLIRLRRVLTQSDSGLGRVSFPQNRARLHCSSCYLAADPSLWCFSCIKM